MLKMSQINGLAAIWQHNCDDSYQKRLFLMISTTSFVNHISNKYATSTGLHSHPLFDCFYFSYDKLHLILCCFCVAHISRQVI